MQIKMKCHCTPIKLANMQNIGKHQTLTRKAAHPSFGWPYFQVCFEFPSSVLPTYISVFMLHLHCPGHYSLITSKSETACPSTWVILFQNFSGYSRSFTFPYKIWICLLISASKSLLGFHMGLHSINLSRENWHFNSMVSSNPCS